MKRTLLLRRAIIAGGAVIGLALAGVGPALAGLGPALAQSAPHRSTDLSDRPDYHYTPAENWMNDPNGLIYDNGAYNLYYQYNPTGDTGGNASWGHATSTDLVHWKRQPVAIPEDDTEEVWSGSVVDDKSNTSGYGVRRSGPLVAIYTSAVRATGVQRQALAYSNDGGMTWTKAGPVLDIDSHNFRDPKVFWYAPAKQWRMVVALSDQHKVSIYSSPDLKTWTHQSDFGPDGVTSAVWECPDLFPLALDGKNSKTKWIMSVSVAGKVEYFVGRFDGTSFTDEHPYTPPAGTVLDDFEAAGYGDGWVTTGTAFGSGPARDTGVTGASGSGYVDTFHNSDDETGTLTSPTFTIDQDYLNFLIAGGNHPYVEGGSVAPPVGGVFEDFEGGSLPGWTGTGDFAGITPSKEQLSGQVGNGVLDTCQAGCDAAEGTLMSPTFTITEPYINMLTAGGEHPWGSSGPTAVNLVVDGKVVASVTGDNSGSMDWTHLDASDYIGQQATLQVVDRSDGSAGWGHLMVDEIVFSKEAAAPWAAETGVNLIVDGKVVRTATGNDSGALDWTSWDLKELRGKQARLQLVDQSTGGWGHLVADQFTFSATAAQSSFQRANWIDRGRDFYAGVTYNDVPRGERIMIGWMNNWDYANSIPASGWRGQQSVPRVLSLRTIDGTPQIVQTAARGVDALQVRRHAQSVRGITTRGTTVLPVKTSTRSARIDAAITPGRADSAGLQILRSADGSQSVGIRYDRASGTLSVDRTHSGDVSFSPAFASVDSAKVPLVGGKLTLRIYVDKQSIEVFAQGGRTVLSDLVFPDAASTGVAVTAGGGKAGLDQLTVTPLADAMP